MMKKSLLITVAIVVVTALILGGCAKPAPAPAPGPAPGPAQAPPPGSAGSVLYVDADNIAGPWDGKSWATAYQGVQEGLDSTEQAGGEVWVAEGKYHPTDNGNREISFQLKSGVDLYGGFKGAESALDQRDWEANVTMLSGDIGKPGDDSDNCYHVVLGANGATIDGFTITGGNGLGAMGEGGPGGPGGPGAGPPPQGPPGEPGAGGLPPIHITPEIVLSGPNPTQGGGILNYQAAPIVRNCIISNNSAGKGGGAYSMCNQSGMFRAPVAAGEEPDYPTFVNVTFIDNHARGRGGGAANDLGTHPTYINCSFINNVCDDKGGGMYNDFGCSPTITSCVFAGNSAVTAGAMGNDGSSSPDITGCTFTGNYAKDLGAALYQGTGPANNPTITNCILWGNIAPSGAREMFNWHECSPVVTCSCVEGGYPGIGNIDSDPLFVDAQNGDYRLAAGSPCTDAGNGSVASGKDRDGKPRYDDRGIPDGLSAASVTVSSPPGGPPPGGPPPGAAPQPAAASAGPPVDIGAYERQSDTVMPALDVVYVDVDNVEGPWDGKSWATAYRNLQKAMDHAYAVDAEVWVARGTYKPAATTERTVSLQLRTGVEMYGGFRGKETARDQRDWEKNVTILSGDIGIAGDSRDNSYHVLVGADDATMDGFTITGGNADGDTSCGKGGGMVNYNYAHARRGPFGPALGYSPTIANCVFIGNQANDGGAMYNYDRCTLTLTNCSFTGNSALNGGAIYDNVGVKNKLTKCTFTGNQAEWRGGALVMDYGACPTLNDCTFIDNSTEGKGGAIYTVSRASQLDRTAPIITNCTFSGNSAAFRGGGIANTDKCLLKVSDCTFSRNHADKGGGAIANDYQAILNVFNCTFIGNSAAEGDADIDTDDTSSAEVR